MKTIIFFLSILFCICNSSKSTNIKYIEMKCMGFDVNTVFDIDCDYIEKEKVIHINNSDTIQKIFNFLVESKKNPINNEVSDIRAKLFIYYNNNTVDTICMNARGLLLNNKSFGVSNEFADFIDNIFYSKELH